MTEQKIVKLEPKTWTWWTTREETIGTDQMCVSVKECIEKAQQAYDSHEDPFNYKDDECPNLISIGSVEYFSLRKALRSSTDCIINHIIEEMDEFLYSSCYEGEYDGPSDEEKDEKFRDEVANALLPIFDKYCDGNNPMVAMPLEGFYDLKRHCWVDEHTLEPLEIHP